MTIYTAKRTDEGAYKISINALPEEAWTYIQGGPTDIHGMQKIWESIPWLHRGIEMCAAAVGNMPFQIMSGENIIDQSDGYANNLGWLVNPSRLMYQVEASLMLTNRAYVFRGSNRIGNIKDFRYMNPGSVKPILDKVDGLTGFKRNMGSEWKEFSVDDFLYFWVPDPYIEIGPSDASPAMAALQASNVLKNLDIFAEKYAERGLIKAILLTVGGVDQAGGITMPVPEKERNRIKEWWDRFRGMAGAWETEVVRADVKPVVIGEGFKELENVNITNEKREDISTALGVPQSLLFSNATNFATAKQDDIHFYKKRIEPDCNFIEAVLNEQLFGPMGYEWKFLPETLDIYQEDEKERSQSLSFLVSAMSADLEVAGLAMEILGFELDEAQQQKLDVMLAAKEQRRQEFADRQSQAAASNEQSPQRAPNTLNPGPDTMSKHLELWQKKAINHVGKPKAAQFESDLIPAVLAGAIAGSLEEAQTEEDVRSIFGNIWLGYP